MLARRFTIVCLLVTLFGMFIRRPRRRGAVPERRWEKAAVRGRLPDFPFTDFRESIVLSRSAAKIRKFLICCLRGRHHPSFCRAVLAVPSLRSGPAPRSRRRAEEDRVGFVQLVCLRRADRPTLSQARHPAL